MELRNDHHNDSNSGLNKSSDFDADVKTIVKRSHDDQDTGAGYIQFSVGDVVIRDGESKTDTCKNGDATHQRDQALMTFTEVGLIH